MGLSVFLGNIIQEKLVKKMKIIVVLYFKGDHASYIIVLNKLTFKDLMKLKDSLCEFKEVFCGYFFWGGVFPNIFNAFY